MFRVLKKENNKTNLFIFKPPFSHYLRDSKSYKPLYFKLGIIVDKEEDLLSDFKKNVLDKFTYYFFNNDHNNLFKLLKPIIKKEIVLYDDKNKNINLEDKIYDICLDSILLSTFLFIFNDCHLNHDFFLSNDEVNSLKYESSIISRDIFILENQIPLKIIIEILKIFNIGNDLSETIILNFVAAHNILNDHNFLYINEGKHLLDMLYNYTTPKKQIKFEEKKNYNWYYNIPSATELYNSGIKFSPNINSICNIYFNKNTKTLFLPHIRLNDNTEVYLKNMLSYESKTEKYGYLIQYIYLMDALINTKNDVDLFKKYKIIDDIISDEDITINIWSNITRGTYILYANDEFNIAITNIINYYNNSYFKLIYQFKKIYFSKPWIVISVLSAIYLIIITTIQTIYTVLSYYKE